MVKNVIFLAVFLFGYTVQAITGFAGNIFCMPVGTLTLGLQSSVSILNATGCKFYVEPMTPQRLFEGFKEAGLI